MRSSFKMTRTTVALLLFAGTLLSGCEPITMTAASIGASAGISHTLTGIVYRTFTLPMTRVEKASVRALKDMGIEVIGRDTGDDGERVITATAKNRKIEVYLEPLTSRTTRLRAMARDGVLQDGATAQEIVAQTERVLGVG